MDPILLMDLPPYTALTTLICTILLTPIPTSLTLPIVLYVLFIHLYTAWRTDLPILLHTLKEWLRIHQLVEDIEQIRYERRRIRARVDMVRRRIIWEKKMEMYREMTREAEKELGLDGEWKRKMERDLGMERSEEEYYLDRGEHRVEISVGGRLKARGEFLTEVGVFNS